jgi:hypothetical protein
MGHDSRANLAGNVVLAKGILNLALGILHVVGTFTFERDKVARLASAALRRDYLVWFYGVGLFIVFMGLIDIVCSAGVKERSRFAWRAALLCATFNLVLGLSGVAIFGVSPPVQLVVTGLVGVVALSAARGVAGRRPTTG